MSLISDISDYLLSFSITVAIKTISHYFLIISGNVSIFQLNILTDKIINFDEV